jgi:hypothetical protein
MRILAVSSFGLSLAVALIIVQGCGSSKLPGGAAETCTITITVAALAAAQQSCIAIGSFDQTANQSSVAISTIPSGSPTASMQSVNIAFKTPGNLQPGTYSSATLTSYGAALTVGSGVIWVATRSPAQGSMSVTVGSLSAFANSNNGQKTGYTLHGTASATLVPQASTGATGDATLQVTF